MMEEQRGKNYGLQNFLVNILEDSVYSYRNIDAFSEWVHISGCLCILSYCKFQNKVKDIDRDVPSKLCQLRPSQLPQCRASQSQLFPPSFLKMSPAT